MFSRKTYDTGSQSTILSWQRLLTYEVRGLGELVQHLHPEVNGLVVHPPQLFRQLHLVNPKGDALNKENPRFSKMFCVWKSVRWSSVVSVVRYPPSPLYVTRTPRASRDTGTGSWRTRTSSFHTPALLIITTSSRIRGKSRQEKQRNNAENQVKKNRQKKKVGKRKDGKERRWNEEMMKRESRTCKRVKEINEIRCKQWLKK